MKTPIYDFVKAYAEKNTTRFHMPGHKGKSFLGCEPFDITEIEGADVLYHASGIIAASEENATALFNTAHTFYSTEGSSHVIKAMLSLIRSPKKRTRILAARNAHKAFIYACALLDLDAVWIETDVHHVCTCIVKLDVLRHAIVTENPDAVYITSPDYLGQIADIKSLASVCKEFNIPLLVDNAHGAYLQFLSPAAHPMALGAAMCADSAHKTLPVLTGGAYLHVAKDAPRAYCNNARRALSLFASTSPSYLTLCSLDIANRYMAESMPEELSRVIKEAEACKNALTELGYAVLPSEPLKIVLHRSVNGYTGNDFSAHLRAHGIDAEFADGEYVVLMLSSSTAAEDLRKLQKVCHAIPRRAPLVSVQFDIPAPIPTCSLREAILGEQEHISIENAEGRICAAPCISCPPAVPIAVSGEKIRKEHIALLRHYGISDLDVLKE